MQTGSETPSKKRKNEEIVKDEHHCAELLDQLEDALSKR